ncbi:fimbrial protein [Vibrio sp. VB16]|uniref:fimbrial protein n=1 Tax=Vibrio sp. VB16 TaxID=2785746 RepID=UPI0018A06D46|nr:fimbrial protein [Vibrio sp. VB16]UGA53581.1 type 1 fimbrial protein [Vibrio sp. VB16]
MLFPHLKLIIFFALMSFHFNAYSCYSVGGAIDFYSLNPILKDIDGASVASSEEFPIRPPAWNWTPQRTKTVSVKGCDFKSTFMSTFTLRDSLPVAVGRINLNDVFPTEYDNIGYMIRSRVLIDSKSWKPLEEVEFSSQRVNVPIGYVPDDYQFKNEIFEFAIEFVVTGPLRVGTYTLRPQTVGSLIIVDGTEITDTRRGRVDIGYDAFTFNVTGSTCDIEASSKMQTVQLPSVASNSFKGLGTTAGETWFTMDLDCPENISIYASMIDSNAPYEAKNFLSLDASSTAAGVGIQVLANNGDTLVQYGGVDQWPITGSNGRPKTKHSIPFIARYVQTEAKVTPGSLSAQSVISFFYE